MTKYKTFNGQTFKLYDDTGSNKRYAEQLKKELKSKGYNVRITSKPNIYDNRATWYFVWYR